MNSFLQRKSDREAQILQITAQPQNPWSSKAQLENHQFNPIPFKDKKVRLSGLSAKGHRHGSNVGMRTQASCIIVRVLSGCSVFPTVPTLCSSFLFWERVKNLRNSLCLVLLHSESWTEETMKIVRLFPNLMVCVLQKPSGMNSLENNKESSQDSNSFLTPNILHDAFLEEKYWFFFSQATSMPYFSTTTPLKSLVPLITYNINIQILEF